MRMVTMDLVTYTGTRCASNVAGFASYLHLLTTNYNYLSTTILNNHASLYMINLIIIIVLSVRAAWYKLRLKKIKYSP